MSLFYSAGLGNAIPDSGDLHTLFDAESLGALYTDTGTITTWPDDSGNGDDISGGDPVYLTAGLNGNPTAEADGNDFLDGSFSTSLDETGMVFFAYIDADSQTDFAGVWSDGATRAFEQWIIRRDSSANYEIQAGSSSVTTSDSNVEDGNSHSLIGIIDSGTLEGFLDGSSIGTTSISAFTSTSAAMFRYEGGAGDFFPWSGRVSEAGTYDVSKPSSFAQDLHDYLDTKWN